MSTDAYLLSKYGITLAEREAIMKEQDYKCVCGRSLKDPDVRLEVDHEHFKVEVYRWEKSPWAADPAYDSPWKHNGWIARPILLGFEQTWYYERTKEKAIKVAKLSGRRASVRGVLCGGRYAGCNRKIGRIDKPEWLLAVHGYLKDPPARRVLK